MSAAGLTWEQSSLRTRTRWSFMVSVVLHTLALLALIFMRTAPVQRETIDEISWLDPGQAAAGEPAPAAAAKQSAPQSGALVTALKELHFERVMKRGDVEPQPQDAENYDTRIADRLAAMQGPTSATPHAVVAPAPTSSWGSAPAGVPNAIGTGGGAGKSLHRGGTGAGTGVGTLALTRQGTGGGGLAPATLPAPSAPAAPAKAEHATSQRVLAGATLTGPIADRKILERPAPVYPEWAKRELVEASVTLYFLVRPDGGVQENVLVQRTAGFEDFDESARTALRHWRFEPLPRGETGEQWGTITFHFRLKGGE